MQRGQENIDGEDKRKNILLAGVGGFIGRRFYERCVIGDINVRRIVHKNDNTSAARMREIGPRKWTRALEDIEIVVHAAVRVQVMHDLSVDPLSEFRCKNIEATLNLAQHAATIKVSRFIYI